jgi:flavin reductase (DIM6/NTAB) family NADH-FMN oxidoreductase RutF
MTTLTELQPPFDYARDVGAFAVSTLLTGPPTILTAGGRDDCNGLVVTTAERASIVPGRPRVLVCVWKYNHTHALVERSGRFALNLIGTGQLPLVRRFGFSSAREARKIDPDAVQLGATGVPLLPEAIAHLECKVASSMDGGDMTVFLADVVAGGRLRDERPMSFGDFVGQLPADWAPLYQAMMAGVVGAAARTIAPL